MSKAYTVIRNGTLTTPTETIPDSIVKALCFNTIKHEFRATLATEGIPRDTVEAMGFGYLEPDQVPDYVQSRMREQPGCTLGVLRSCVEVLPLHHLTGPEDDGLV